MNSETAWLDHHFILLRKIPLIYARVPKVANTSVKLALASLVDPSLEPNPDILTADSAWKQGSDGESKMVNAMDAQRRRSSHFIFSFVRNPYDRLVSAYNNKLIENDHLSSAMQKMGLKRLMPFDQFLEVVAATPNDELDIHLLPQSRILCIEGQVIPHFIGKIEAMPSHWQLLQQRMNQAGLPAVGNLPKANVRRKHLNDLPNYFNTSHRIKLVANRYSDDLALFYSGDDLDALARGEQHQSCAAFEKTADSSFSSHYGSQPP